MNQDCVVVALSSAPELVINADISTTSRYEPISLEAEVFRRKIPNGRGATETMVLWQKAGLHVVIGTITDTGHMDVQNYVRPLPVSLNEGMPNFYVAQTEVNHDQHIAVVDAATGEACALTGFADGVGAEVRLSLQHAILFAQAPKLYNMVVELLERFAGDYEAGDSAVVDRACHLLNSFPSMPRYAVPGKDKAD